MNARTLIARIACDAAVLLLLGLALSASAQNAPRSTYDFEDGPQGFTAILLKDGQVTPAADSVTVAREKDLVKSGAGSLRLTYTVTAGQVHAAFAEARLPQGTQAVRFWARSSVPTVHLFSVREEDESSYQLPFYLPANEWVQVTANLDELTPTDEKKDENGQLDVDQAASIGAVDIAAFLALNPAAAALLPKDAGPRSLWLDDLQFLSERVTQASGVVKSGDTSAYLVDNFETGLVAWTPARVTLVDNAPSFELFPADASLKVLAEAAAPGAAKTPLEPGGKGLRFAYNRAPGQIYALVRSLERTDLSKAEKLRLNINISQKSLVVVSVKEKDDSEYNQILLPDDTTGWRTMDLPFSLLALGDNSKDENGKLDPDQIKEVTVVDASAFVPDLPGGAVTLDLDAVWFGLK